jgi:ankyrin repeat protein
MDVHKSTPLHRACSTCQEGLVEILIGAGADIGAIDANGDTAMHIAVEAAQDRQSAQAAFLLAAKGAPLQVKNKDGQTPLTLAGENADALRAAAESSPKQ